MCSTSEVLARPVRSRLSSWRKEATHLPMRSVASFLMSSSIATTPLRTARAVSVRDQGADVLAARGAHQGTWFVQVEYAQRQLVIAAEHDRGGVHHVQALVEHLVVVQAI